MQVLHQLPKFNDPNLLISAELRDDAGVYAITEDLAIVQSVDLLTPVADDPYTFGQIAAANSLSDIYAMGAKPITGLSVISFPVDKVANLTIARILKGVADKVIEAGAVIVGGHTLKDTEIKCGLAVTGVIKPDKIITKSKAGAGEKIILTKPLGTGIISTALKVERAPAKAIKKINYYMSQLNRAASEAMVQVGVSSATDITGFGLLGHAWEIAEFSNVSLKISASDVPVIDEAYELAKLSLFPAGSIKNFEFIKAKASFGQNIKPELQMLLCDAQTSGGLLITISEGRANTLLNLLHKRGITAACIIGEVIPPKEKRIYVE